MAFVELIKLHELHEGLRRRVTLAGRDYILIHQDGQTRLIANACPHAGAPLSAGTINNGAIRCAKHGIEFDLLSGKPLSAGCNTPLQFMRLDYSGNTLGVYV